MNNVLGMVPESTEKKSPVIIGLIPCWNRFFLDPAWSAVRLGVQELAQIALDEFTPLYVWQQVFSGRFQLYLAYIDRTGTATEPKYQEMFVERLRTPLVDFAGFFILDVMREKAIHVFAGYIMPEYRDKNLWQIGYDYIESQVKSIGAKELTVTMPKETLESMKARGYDEGLLNMRKILK